MKNKHWMLRPYVCWAYVPAIESVCVSYAFTWIHDDSYVQTMQTFRSRDSIKNADNCSNKNAIICDRRVNFRIDKMRRKKKLFPKFYSTLAKTKEKQPQQITHAFMWRAIKNGFASIPLMRQTKHHSRKIEMADAWIACYWIAIAEYVVYFR